MRVIPTSEKLIPMIEDALYMKWAVEPYSVEDQTDISRISSVLLLLGYPDQEPEEKTGACFILNKRSEKVRQSGDLCCPGGGTEPRLDRCLARLLHLPYSPLRRWSYWMEWRQRRSEDIRRLSLFLATSLRESFEEMRVNPLRVRFLGPLAPQKLLLMQKTVFPMAGWIHGNKRFHPNGEVDEIVYLPLSALFDPSQYRRFRFRWGDGREISANSSLEYPSFAYKVGDRTELLWGVTYRMVMSFMETVFDFHPPELHILDVFERELDPGYMTGASRGREKLKGRE